MSRTLAILIAGAVIAASAQARAAAPSLDAVEAQARALSGRIDREADRRAIEKLQMTYGFYVDKKLWDQVSDLFARNGTMELDNRGVFVGQASIRRSLEMFGPQPIRSGELFNHMQLQPVVTVAPGGRAAKGRWHAFVQVGISGGAGEWAEGVYENAYVKQDGVWKIAALRYCQTMRTDYDKGWARDAAPAPGTSAAYRPDRASTGGCTAYPAVAGPAFHFKNPVTGK